MNWTKSRILKELRSRHRRGEDLAYSRLAGRDQALLSAASYHFGSYRAAIEAAGIDYASVIRRPRWNKQNIIRLIKQARRDGQDLHWSAVTRRKDQLACAAYAATQPRLFGRWDRALHAAGMDADDVMIYRTWDRASVVFELKSRKQDGDALNSGALQRDDAGLHAAAIRHFGNFPAALRAAGFNPTRMRERRRWNERLVIRSLKSAFRRGLVSDTALRRTDGGLYGAAVRLFGTFTAARRAAGFRAKRAKK